LLTRALFLNGENERAAIELQKLKESADPLSSEITKVLSVLDKKIQLELTNLSRVGSINDAAYLGASPKQPSQPIITAPAP